MSTNCKQSRYNELEPSQSGSLLEHSRQDLLQKLEKIIGCKIGCAGKSFFELRYVYPRKNTSCKDLDFSFKAASPTEMNKTFLLCHLSRVKYSLTLIYAADGHKF